MNIINQQSQLSTEQQINLLLWSNPLQQIEDVQFLAGVTLDLCHSKISKFVSDFFAENEWISSYNSIQRRICNITYCKSKYDNLSVGGNVHSGNCGGCLKLGIWVRGSVYI